MDLKNPSNYAICASSTESKVTVTVTIVRSSHLKAAKTPGKLTSRAFGTSVRFDKGTVNGKRSSTCKPESKKID